MTLNADQEVAGGKGEGNPSTTDIAKTEKPESISKAESLAVGDVEEDDPWQPLRGVEVYDGRRILTFRAVFSGFLLGSVILCANMFLGLKAGFGADATLFSAIFGFAICKGLEKSNIPFLSGYFGPHENNIIQATAIGCIGIGFMFISGVPAMYQLGLLGTPESDLGTLISFSLVAGFWGLGFAAPFRSVFILRLARQLSLVFPYGTASAVTIRALHSSNGSQSASQRRDNFRGISITFIVSLLWAVGTSYAPGILYTWAPFWWIYKWGGRSIVSAVNWGWVSWSWSPSVLGIGMLVDLNAALSFLLGSVLAWGVIGPATVAAGVAAGIPYHPDYPDLITYNAFIPDQFISMPSPRYWILWPAVFMMLGVSITMILLETKSLGRLAQYGSRKAWAAIRARLYNQPGNNQHAGEVFSESDIQDPVAPEHRVRWWEWASVCVGSFVIALVAMKYTMGISPALNLLNLLMGLLWSFVVIHTMGSAGVTPISTVAKGSQFITGGILRDQMHNFDSVARSNLSGALISAAATQQSAELCQDFRTGFLLGTPARTQWHAQMIGTLTSVILGPCLFMLFTKAFPCILDPAATTCQFGMPAVTAWRIITEAIFMPEFPISRSSWIFSIVLTGAGIGSVVLRRWLGAHPSLSAWQHWVPNMSLVGLAMTVPGSNMMLTVAMGSVAAALWKRFYPRSHGRFMYPVAAGGIAGEGVAFVIQAILQIAAVGGPNYFGTHLGCVGEQC